eukprot:NODE_34_length_36538_cov_0.612854.p4 type:complete len:639 gc:universal NODE_34_length_36538_cov_0.612854:24892-26808(+)
MKWLLTFNSTCVETIVQEIKSALPVTLPMHVYTNFPVIEIEANSSQIAVLSKIPCILTNEKQIMFKSHETQSPTSWVLDSLDGTKLDDSYSFTRTGKDVQIYVIDSGIDTTHRDFEDRAEITMLVNETLNDCTGHGSHVAGLIAGRNVGVAKKAKIHSIKVITCTDDSDNFIIVKAYDAIVSDFNSKGLKSALVNLSLGPHAVNGDFPQSPSLEAAINAAFNKNILTIAASGNDNLDACSGTPSRLDTVVTVGAIDQNFARASFSNFGDCVKVVAPGVNSVSVKANTNDQYTIKQGTSQAAPLVTGILALILEDNPNANIKDLYGILRGESYGDGVSDLKSSASVLAQTYLPDGDKSGNIQFDSIDYAALQGDTILPLWAIILIAFAVLLILGIVIFKLTRKRNKKASKRRRKLPRANRQHTANSEPILEQFHQAPNQDRRPNSVGLPVIRDTPKSKISRQSTIDFGRSFTEGKKSSSQKTLLFKSSSKARNKAPDVINKHQQLASSFEQHIVPPGVKNRADLSRHLSLTKATNSSHNTNRYSDSRMLEKNNKSNYLSPQPSIADDLPPIDPNRTSKFILTPDASPDKGTLKKQSIISSPESESTIVQISPHDAPPRQKGTLLDHIEPMSPINLDFNF